MIKATLPLRGTDPMGAGHYGAPRGSRTHRGIDYAAEPGTGIHPVKAGVVSKLGYTYSDDLSYRYVEVTDERGYRHRYFYVEPECDVGDLVYSGDTIGTVQDLLDRRDWRERGMKNHIHYEVIDPSGQYINPGLV